MAAILSSCADTTIAVENSQKTIISVIREPTYAPASYTMSPGGRTFIMASAQYHIIIKKGNVRECTYRTIETKIPHDEFSRQETQTDLLSEISTIKTAIYLNKALEMQITGLGRGGCHTITAPPKIIE